MQIITWKTSIYFGVQSVDAVQQDISVVHILKRNHLAQRSVMYNLVSG